MSDLSNRLDYVRKAGFFSAHGASNAIGSAKTIAGPAQNLFPPSGTASRTGGNLHNSTFPLYLIFLRSNLTLISFPLILVSNRSSLSLSPINGAPSGRVLGK